MRELLFIILAMLMSGCSILPGMQNLDTGTMQIIETPRTVCPVPTIIPITASLLCDHPFPPYVYHIEPQDVLSVVVWLHPEFNTPIQQTATTATQSSQAEGQSGYLVNHSGNIYFPLIGYVRVAGKTMDQVRVELTRRLKVYIRNPQVMVRVSDYRSKKIYVLGEVMKPGLLPLNDQPMSITDALTLTGSIDPNAADPHHIYVIRGNFIRPKIYWLKANTPDKLLLAEQFQLLPDDILYVSAAYVARWNRLLNQLLPTLQAYWFTKAITHTRD